MTDNEIIKALERCGQHYECCYCNSVEECGSKRVLVDNCLDLINRQKAEIINRTEEYNDMLEQRNKVEEALEIMTMDVNSLTSERDALNEMVIEQKAELAKKDTEINILIRKKEALRDEISELKAEVERLEGILNKRCDVCPAVTTAIKEFAEKFEKEIETTPNMNSHFRYALLRYAKQIKDNLEKEMTEAIL